MFCVLLHDICNVRLCGGVCMFCFLSIVLGSLYGMFEMLQIVQVCLRACVIKEYVARYNIYSYVYVDLYIICSYVYAVMYSILVMYMYFCTAYAVE